VAGSTLYREIDLAQRLYVVGDLHGCIAETEIMLKHLEVSEELTAEDVVIFIGDYIDRGADSKLVVEALLSFRVRFPQTIFLKGNHEEMLLSFLGFGAVESGLSYLANGGEKCLVSYGFSLETPPGEVLTKLPASHLDFYRSLDHYVIAPGFVFTHAGLNPIRELHSQVEEDLLWIRNEFIYNVHYFKHTVIFGHTPYENVLFHLPFKVGLDTGLVYGNMLSALELIEGKVFQVRKGSPNVQSFSVFDFSGVQAWPPKFEE
jgi:serine/threonine protein phosphatase 1